MAEDWFDSVIETAGDVGKTALNAIYGSKQAEAENQLLMEQTAEKKEENKEFWKKFAIVSGVVVGGLVIGKILKLY